MNTLTPTTTFTPTPTVPAVPSGQIWRKYYFAGSQRIALRVAGDPISANNGVFYMLGDHLGSTNVVVGEAGNKLAELRYKAWGELRFPASPSAITDYRFTGQRQEAGIGLYYYRARWYDPALGRFAQADTIVPGGGSPSGWDRYAYVFNNPTKHTDPSGHKVCDDVDAMGNCITAPGTRAGGGGGYIGVPPAKKGVTHKERKEPLTDRINKGDLGALVELLIPSHLGGRLQFEANTNIPSLPVGLSITLGFNAVHNRYQGRMLANVDWGVEPGIGLGRGISITGGPLIGWGSTRAADVTAGHSALLSGTVAGGPAGAITISSPLEGASPKLHVDPYSGQVPATIFLGVGAGGGYAGAGGGVTGEVALNGEPLQSDISWVLPWNWGIFR